MKVVIEGMDGVGKSTVAKIVADKLGFRYVDGVLKTFLTDSGINENEMKVFYKIRDLLSDNENSIMRTWAYGFPNLFNFLHYNDNLVIDRHCLTTYYYNGDSASKFLYKIMQEITGKPDIVVILKASIATRISRIQSRNKFDSDLLKSEKLMYGYDKLEEAAQFLNLNYVIVETDSKPISQVVDEVVEIVMGAC